MKELFFTSCVLIGAVFLLRFLFHKTISRRLQYALWLVVAVRLLLPVSLPGLPISVLSSTREVQASLDTALSERSIYVLPLDRSPIAQYPQADGVRPGEQVPDASSFGYPVLNADGVTVTRYADQVSLAQVLSWVWWGGMALVGGCFLISNYLFSRKLYKARTPYTVDGAALPVFLVEDLPSPCLFGLFSPAVYVNAAAVEDTVRLRHVLAHEMSHYAQRDHLWAVLRCLCVTIHWFNPLVWAAAWCSKADCELACDERSTAVLGEAERLSYGQTLLSLIPVRTHPANPLLTATTMTSGKRALTDRIRRIAQRPQTVAAALFLAVTLVALICVVTFTGEGDPPIDPQRNADVGEPDITISLRSVKPYVPVVEGAGEVSGDDVARVLTCNAEYDDRTKYYEVPSGNVFCYESVDGDFYLAWSPTDAEADTIHRLERLPEDTFERSLRIGPTKPIFGKECFRLMHIAPEDEGRSKHDFFTIPDEGLPTPLVLGHPGSAMDLDGDGRNELLAGTNVSQYAFYYQRKGKTYFVDAYALLREAIPQEADKDYATYTQDKANRIIFTGADEDFVVFYRSLGFNGRDLEVWLGDTRQTVDHAMDTRYEGRTRTITEKDDVLAAAKDWVRQEYEKARETQPEQNFDDWRVENLTVNSWTKDFHGLSLAYYKLNYEFHTETPESVILAGGAYVTEDGWVMPSYPDCTYLVFQTEGETYEPLPTGGKRTFLFSMMVNDSTPGNDRFREDLLNALEEHGYLDAPPIESPALSVYLEGVEETVSAQRFALSDTASLLIPAEGWNYAPSPIGDHRWVSSLNENASLSVGIWPAFLAENILETQFGELSGYTFIKDPAMEEVWKEGVYGHDEANKQGVWLLAQSDGEQVYVLLWQWPDEVEEGLGAYLQAMGRSFELSNTLPPPETE